MMNDERFDQLLDSLRDEPLTGRCRARCEPGHQPGFGRLILRAAPQLQSMLWQALGLGRHAGRRAVGDLALRPGGAR